MIIYIASDHRGSELKAKLLQFIKDSGYEIMDVYPEASEGDDYPDVALKVAEKISAEPVTSRGILICGSGAGVDIVANKFKSVRSALGISPDQIYDARHDDNVNILSLSADFSEHESALKMAKIFLTTPFGGEERFTRRLRKITDIEQKNL